MDDNFILNDLTNIDDMDYTTVLYIREVEHIPLLTTKEQKELFYRLANGDLCARNRLIEAYLYLVIKVVKKMMSKGLSFIDLIDEGNIALINAVETFDINSDSSFYSYAHLLIYRHICNVVDSQIRSIKAHNISYSKVLKCRNIQQKLMEELGYKPTTEQISEKLGMPVEETKLILKWQMYPSIDELSNQESKLFIADTLVEDYVITKLDFLTAKEMFKILGEDEVLVLTYHFGLNGVEKQSLEKIGNYLNIKKETTRQIELRALKKLRREFNKRKLDALKKNAMLLKQKKQKKYIRRFIYKGKNNDR